MAARRASRRCARDLANVPADVHLLEDVPDNLLCLGIGPNGPLVFGGRKIVEVRDLDSALVGVGRRLRVGSPATAVAFSGVDRNSCAIGDASGCVHLFDVGGWKEALTLDPAGHAASVTTLAFCRDDLRVVVGHGDGPWVWKQQGDGRRLWDTVASRCVQEWSDVPRVCRALQARG